MLGIKFFLLTIKINEESDEYSVLQKGIFRRSREYDLQSFLGGKPQDPQFPPVSFASFFYGYNVPPTLSSSNYLACRLDCSAHAIN